MVTPVEDTVQEVDTLVQAGFTKDEIVSILWLRQWHQTGGSDRVAVVRYLEFLKRGLKVMDSTAISLCRDNSLPIVIFNLNKSGNIRRVVTGEKVGSLVMA